MTKPRVAAPTISVIDQYFSQQYQTTLPLLLEIYKPKSQSDITPEPEDLFSIETTSDRLNLVPISLDREEEIFRATKYSQSENSRICG
jgi:hypothetical protein